MSLDFYLVDADEIIYPLSLLPESSTYSKYATKSSKGKGNGKGKGLLIYTWIFEQLTLAC